MNVQPGKKLGGYQLLSRIASGGQAEIFRAKAISPAALEKLRQGEFVVIKRLLPAFRQDANRVKRFWKEGELMSRLQHPCIVHTLDFFRQDKDCVLVQEWIDGQTLEKIQERCRQRNRFPPLDAVVFVLKRLLLALCHIHELSEEGMWHGLVHADLSPANVLLSKDGEVKLIDFGVARLLGEKVHKENELHGTIAYMSPEAMLGHPVDERADLYSVGVLLWEFMTNHRLFDGSSEVERMHKVKNARVPSVTHYNSRVPHFSELILRKALAVHPESRFASARAFIQALDALAQRMGLKQDASLVAKLLEV